MIVRAARCRRRPAPVGWILLLLLLLLAAPLAAQDPPPPPPPPPDTIVVPADTAALPADTAAVPADTLAPGQPAAAPARFARWPHPTADGWAAGVWVFERTDLVAGAAFTLTELLQRIPGVVPVKAGPLGQPEAVSALGMAGGRTEIVVDGFVLDPLTSADFDLSRLALVHLERVRVERRLDLLRIEIETLDAPEARPYSLIEAGDGDLRTNVFRGVFIAPGFLGGTLALAAENINTRGHLAREDASGFTGWAKYGISRSRGGVQMEFRRGSLDRGGASPYAGEYVRTDWVLRGRAALLPGVAAEAYFGRTTEDDGFGADTLPDFTDDPGGDDEDPSDVTGFEPRSSQAGLRVAYHPGPFWASAAYRYRDHPAAPQGAAEVLAGVDLPGIAALDGGARWATWEEAGALVTLHARAVSAAFFGLRGVAQWSAGERGATAGRRWREPVVTDRNAVRLGAEYGRGGLRLGAAALRVAVDSVAGFALPFDAEGARTFSGGTASGWELAWRVPLFMEPLWIEGSQILWSGGPNWIYRPNSSGRAALVLAYTPARTRNAEFLARLEGRHRGQMLVPASTGGADVVAEQALLDFYFQLRVLDVRAFIRWENLTSALDAHDIPGRPAPGRRAFYGVHWQLWN
jgi:hypothetical protein